MRFFASLVSVTLMFGCGKSHQNHDSAPAPQNSPNPDDGKTQSPNPLPTPSPSISDVQYQFDTIIREFGSIDGQPDRAVLFIVLPSAGQLDVTQVRGPTTSKNAYVGVIDDKASMKIKIFNQSAIPMSDADRQQLLQKYNGGTAIYIEHYETALCDGDKKEFIMGGSLSGVPLNVDFQFEAEPNATENCNMHVSADAVCQLNGGSQCLSDID